MIEKINDTSITYKIKRLGFHVLSHEEIERLSSVNITTKTLYDIGMRKPSPNGPLDLRLGVSTKIGICETCSESLQNCAGHFGNIRLILPVYHIGFLKHIITILNCICKHCGCLLLSFNKKLLYTDNVRVEAVKNECKKAKTCPNCRKPNGPVKKITDFEFITKLNPTKILVLLKSTHKHV